MSRMQILAIIGALSLVCSPAQIRGAEGEIVIASGEKLASERTVKLTVPEAQQFTSFEWFASSGNPAWSAQPAVSDSQASERWDRECNLLYAVEWSAVDVQLLLCRRAGTSRPAGDTIASDADGSAANVDGRNTV